MHSFTTPLYVANLTEQAAMEDCNTTLHCDDEPFEVHLTVVAPLLVLFNTWTIMGNLMVGVALFRFQSLRRISNYLIGNLALSDFLLAVTVLPFSMTSDLLGHWVFGEMLCKMWLAVDVLYCTASNWNICAIAFDRFTATTFPLWYRERRSGLTALVYIAVVWIWSFVISVPPIVLSQSAFNETYSRVNNTDMFICKLYDQQWYVIYSATGSFILPIAVLTILYAKIFLVLHRQGKIKQHKRSNAADTVNKLSNAHSPAAKDTSKTEAAAPQGDTQLQTLNRVRSLDSLPIGQLRNQNADCVDDEWRDAPTELLYCSKNGSGQSNVARHASSRLPTAANNAFRQLLRGSPRHVSISDQPSPAACHNGVSCLDNSLNQHVPQDAVQVIPVSPKSDKIVNRHGTLRTLTRRRQSLKRFTRREAEATRKCLYIIIAFFIAWIPFMVTYLLRGMADISIHPYVMTAIIWCGYGSSAINPCLYALYNEEFRQAFKKILGSLMICKKDSF